MTSIITEEPKVDLATPRLYREDLERMAQIVHDACERQVKIKFTDKRGYRSTGYDPSCFAEHHRGEGASEALEFLTISGTSGKEPPAIKVTFSPGGSSLFLTNPDSAARGAASQIRALCEERSRRSRRKRAFWGPWLAFVLMLFYTATAILHTFIDFALDGSVDGPSLRMLVWVPACGVLWLLLLWSKDDVGKPKLVNAPRAERPSWWQRHRRDVTYLFIGWLLGACTSYWVNQIPPPTQLPLGDWFGDYGD